MRPPIATKRLSVDGLGRVVYRYKQPFRDGSMHVILEPLDFVARLVALVPRPRLNLTLFHGVFRFWPLFELSGLFNLNSAKCWLSEPG